MDLLSFEKLLSLSIMPLYGITFIIALVTFQKYSNSRLKFLPLLLLLTLLFEFFGDQLWSVLGDRNTLVYNIYNPLYFTFFLYVFKGVLLWPKHRAIIKYLIVIYVLIVVVNPVFQNFVLEPQLASYVFGGLAIISCVVMYFIEILESTKVLVVKYELLFWISVGLLLFYTGYIPIKIYRYFFAKGGEVMSTLRTIHLVLLIIMNCSFIFGFLWVRKK